MAFSTDGKGDDQRIIAQLMNSRDVDAETRIEWQGRFLRVKLPALSITTCQWSATGDSDKNHDSGSK